jgi:Ca2+-binding RTX toxin-like protein
VLIYAAAPGERNQVAITSTSAGDGIVVLHDAGASVQPEAGCTLVDEHTVRCAGARSVVVNAGDADDAVTLPRGPTGGSIVAIGGAGADTLSGGGALYGGPGNDVLTGSDSGVCENPKGGGCGETLMGGAGNDVLRGGGGGDSLIGDGANTPADDRPGVSEPERGDDVIDGGPGEDTVAYVGRSVGVRVDLADSAPGGSDGERDRTTRVENAVGGDGADMLLGNDERNMLTGGGGDDRMDGRGG